MVSQRTLLCGSLLLLTMVDWCPKVGSLQCYGCNLKTGSQEMDVGCSSPEQMTCSPSHQGFKHRFCIRIVSVVLGEVLASGCATARQCQQEELPGVRIQCCTSDLCNHSAKARLTLPLTFCLLFSIGTACAVA
ncbi:prostate stem cell antigen-like isoform X2 [Mobula hypostoma]|uniref:prostate stem cell antigen-like isoform X2 n=1 Tax=Mobula hypostoma TaxID=723540 RepID=UPI002FC31D3D